MVKKSVLAIYRVQITSEGSLSALFYEFPANKETKTERIIKTKQTHPVYG